MTGEKYLHFAWKEGLIPGKRLISTCGQSLEILSPGIANTNAGPDFFNALIRIGRLLWAGNVELHSRASDWYHHGHHLDPVYNNVILHVVLEYDCDICNSLGRRIPAFVMGHLEMLKKAIQGMQQVEGYLPCQPYLHVLPENYVNNCLAELSRERSCLKSCKMRKLLREHPNPDEVLYRQLAYGLGIPLNTYPFECLAHAAPLKKLLAFRDSLFDLEALLFGSSGLLKPARDAGPYPRSLWDRYKVLRPFTAQDAIAAHDWRFLRLRPASFPTLRISQLADLIHRRFPLTDALGNASGLSELDALLCIRANSYWNDHYVFGVSSPPLPKTTGTQMRNILLINIIIPYLSALGQMHEKSGFPAISTCLLKQIEAESNVLIKKWAKFGIKAQNAFESQAILQLHQLYCKQKRCTECPIGKGLLLTAYYEEQ